MDWGLVLIMAGLLLVGIAAAVFFGFKLGRLATLDEMERAADDKRHADEQRRREAFEYVGVPQPEESAER